MSEGPHLDFKIYFSNDFSSDLGKGSYERNPLCYLPVLSEDKFTADSCKDSDGTGIQFCSLKPDIIKATTNPDNNIYSVKPDFKLNIDYSFDEYDNLIETSKKIAEEATQKCYKGGVDFDKCINGLLNRKTDFKWSFACVKTEDEESVSNRMLRLCAESKYKLSSLGSLQNPIYKIAVFAGDTIPPEPVKNVKAENTLGAEENITISFDANAEPDIDYYVVYYSENQFTSVTDEGVLGLGNVEHKGTETHSKTFKIPEDKKTYYFAVAAVDTSGNEGEFEAPISGISEDNLNPGSVELITFERAPGEAPQINVFITPPEENTDKTKLKDLEKYLFYLKETSAALCTLNDVKDALKTKIETISLNMLAVPNKALIELPDAQKAYCLVVIAEDEEPAISLSDETAMRPRYSEKSIVSVKI